MRFRYQVLLLTLVIATMFCANSFAKDGSKNNSDAEFPRITVSELQAKLAKHEKVLIIDVRGGDYDQSDSKIAGALRIAPGEIQSRIADLPHDREIITYCSCPTDGGAVSAGRILNENGFKNVRALKGGWPAWIKIGAPVEPK